jgi:hypothetical protein
MKDEEYDLPSQNWNKELHNCPYKQRHMILYVYILMSFDFPFVRLFGVQ